MKDKSLKKFTISARIPFYSLLSKLVFVEDFIYTTKSDLRIKVLSSDDAKTYIEIFVECIGRNKEDTKIKVLEELQRLGSIISWEFNMPLSEPRISGIDITGYGSEKSDKKIKTITNTLSISSSYALLQKIGKDRIKLIKKTLKKPLDLENQIIFTMYQQAISVGSEPMQFLLLFRLLEYISGLKLKNRNVSERMLADDWIKENYSNVELVCWKKGNISIYTHLRDNIHPKPNNEYFPIQKYKDHLVPFQGVVKDAINQFIK